MCSVWLLNWNSKCVIVHVLCVNSQAALWHPWQWTRADVCWQQARKTAPVCCMTSEAGAWFRRTSRTPVMSDRCVSPPALITCSRDPTTTRSSSLTYKVRSQMTLSLPWVLKLMKCFIVEFFWICHVYLFFNINFPTCSLCQIPLSIKLVLLGASFNSAINFFFWRDF